VDHIATPKLFPKNADLENVPGVLSHSEQLTSATSCFGEEETEQLTQLLESYSSEVPAIVSL